MPILTGYDVVSEISPMLKKLDKSHRPYIIACTAHGSDQEEVRAKIFGFDDFISKPIMKLDLSKLLCDWYFSTHYDRGAGTAAPHFNRESTYSNLER